MTAWYSLDLKSSEHLGRSWQVSEVSKYPASEDTWGILRHEVTLEGIQKMIRMGDNLQMYSAYQCINIALNRVRNSAFSAMSRLFKSEDREWLQKDVERFAPKRSSRSLPKTAEERLARELAPWQLRALAYLASEKSTKFNNNAGFMDFFGVLSMNYPQFHAVLASERQAASGYESPRPGSVLMWQPMQLTWNGRHRQRCSLKRWRLQRCNAEKRNGWPRTESWIARVMNSWWFDDVLVGNGFLIYTCLFIYMICFIQFDWMFTHTLHNKSPRSWPWQEAQKLRAFKAQRLSSASVDVGDTLGQAGSTSS